MRGAALLAATWQQAALEGVKRSRGGTRSVSSTDRGSGVTVVHRTSLGQKCRLHGT